MRSSAVPLVVALILAGYRFSADGQGAHSPGPATTAQAVADNVRSTEALIADLEHEDLVSMLAMMDEEVKLVMPLAPDGNNDPTHIDRFEGRQAVRSLLWRTFLAYRRISFVDSVITPSSDGRVIFVEARGDFLTLDGRSYRNVYLIKLVFDDAGAVTGIEEWTNPVTASLTWGFPIGKLPSQSSTSADSAGAGG